MLFLFAGAMQHSSSSAPVSTSLLSVAASASSHTVATLQTRPTDFQAGFMAAFQDWVVSCRLRQWINLNLNQQCEEGCVVKVPLCGIHATPELDVSLHGRQYSGLVFHGNSFSYLPSICSAGCLLRCSIPTRGKHSIWVGESFSRALLYASPMDIGGKQVQCVVGVQAKRIKGSHFKSHDKQLILRGCWGQLEWLMVKEYKGDQLYKRRADPLSGFLPKFTWMPSYSNWDPLPPPWVVTNSISNPSSVATGVPPIPYPA